MSGQSRPQFIGENKHRLGTGVLDWGIDGPATVVGQPACPIHPEFFYEVFINNQVDSKILHIIWNKKPPAGSTAIERVMIDNEGDYADGKTPHYCDLAGRVCVMSFCSYGVYDLQVSVLWIDTSNNDKHMDMKSLKITSRPPGP
jgi:hypothetical protein